MQKTMNVKSAPSNRIGATQSRRESLFEDNLFANEAGPVNLADLLPPERGYHYAPVEYKIPVDFKLSIVIPVYNEESTILKLLGRVAPMPLNKEIIIVDDCSTDSTLSLLDSITAAHDVRVVSKDENCGKGAALKTGFNLATGNVVIVQDGDLEYDPRDIPGLIEPLVSGDADVVYGSRYMNRSEGDHWFHRFGNWLLTALSNLSTGLRLSDMETCYKAFHRDVLRSFEIQQERFGVEPEITAKIARRKFTVAERPIGYDARDYQAGKKIGIRDGFNALYCIARYGLRD
jgi:glycosyltransferase involved in cell wall biosynthesis